MPLAFFIAAFRGGMASEQCRARVFFFFDKLSHIFRIAFAWMLDNTANIPPKERGGK